MSTATPKQTPPAPGVLEYLDPHTIAIGENVRDNATDGQPFTDLVNSIKEEGVLVALSAVRDATGKIVVRDGQRRTLAARKAGLATIPVMVTEDTATTDKARTVQRITHQIVANDRRVPLTESQRAKGIQELLINDLKPAQIAKKLTVSTETVQAAAKAVASQQALAALDANQLSIEQAAELVEFEQDPDALDYLTTAETPGQFEHRINELREKVQAAQAREEAEKPYREKGFTILEKRPRYGDKVREYGLDTLYDADAKALRDNTEFVTAHPELWAVYLEETVGYLDTRTGALIDEDQTPVDWDLDADDVDTAAEEGYIHPQHVQETDTFEPMYFCIDPNAAGVYHYSEVHRGNAKGAESEKQALARKEAERREKRKVIELNKLGAAALVTRRKWVSTLLTRKTPPKGTAIFLAQQLANRPNLLGYNSKSTAAALLGDGVLGDKAMSALAPTADSRAVVIILGLVLAALEDETPKDAWRRSGALGKTYLQFLEANGYELAEVEKVITGALKADKLYDKLIADRTKSEPEALAS